MVSQQQATPVTEPAPAGLALVSLLPGANQQDLVWREAALATRPRPVAYREAQAVDSRLRPADRGFPSLALRPKLVSASRLVSVMQMEQRMARARPWEQRKLAVRVWRSD